MLVKNLKYTQIKSWRVKLKGEVSQKPYDSQVAQARKMSIRVYTVALTLHINFYTWDKRLYS